MQKNDNLDTTIVNSVTLGKILGITDRRVRQMVQENIIEQVGRGKYELIKSIQRYCNYLRQKAEVDSNKIGAKLDYETERALHEKAKREKAELQLKVMKGELHRGCDVEQVMADMITRSKTKLLALPSKVAPLVIGYKDINHIQDIMQKYIEESLEEISDYNPELFTNDEVIQGDDDE